MSKWLMVLVFAVASCGGEGESEGEGEHDQRFSGMWIVDQPFHAGYEATVYQFEADGEVRALDACNFSGLGDDYVTGTVEHETGTRCVFGRSWRSSGPDRLIVTGDCDDDLERPIALGFDADTSRNTEGTTVTVDSVAGESGWAHRDFDWQWTRCPEAGCEPVWVCR